MMPFRISIRLLERLSAAALVASVLLLARALWLAYYVPPGEVAVASPPGGAESVAQARSVVASDAAAALDSNPFRVTRDRPRRRYEPLRVESAVESPAVSIRAFALNGTITYGAGRGAAILRFGGDSTVMLRVGDRLDEYTLSRVERDRAVLMDSSGVELVLSQGDGGSP